MANVKQQQRTVGKNDKEQLKELAQNNQRIMALEDNFEALYDVELDSARYTAFIRGKYYQDNVVDKLLNGDDYFKDLRKDIESVVYSEDIDGLYNVLTKEALQKELAEKERFEHYYRILIGNVPKWLKIRVVYKDKARNNVIIGVFNAEKEMAEKLQREQEAKKNEAIAKSFSKEYQASFIWDLSDDTYKVISNNDRMENQITNIPLFSDAIRIYVKKFVHPSDADKFDDIINNYEVYRDRLEIGQPYNLEYKSKTSGDYRWMCMTFKRNSDTDVLIGIRDCDDEIVQRNIESKLLSEYDALYLVNLDKNEIRAVRSSRIAKAYAFKGTLVYSEVLKKFADTVAPQYKQDWIQFSDPAYMREFLKNEDSREYIYEIPGQARTLRRFTADVLERVNGEPAKLLFSFMGIDDERAQTIRLHQQLAEQATQLEEALADALIANQRAAVLHKLMKSGQWSYGINKKDEVVSVKYEDITIRTKNISDQFNGAPMKWVDYLHPEDKERVVNGFYAAIKDHSGQTLYDEMFRVLDTDGTYRWAKSIGQLIRHEDGTAELFGMNMDITDQVAEQKRQQEELEKAYDAAQSANQAKTVFMNNMSHDIRTPMNAIIGYTSMAKKYITDTERATDYINKIGIAGNNLLVLINQVLDMSRIESGKIVLNEEPIDARERTTEITELVSNSAQAKDITLTTHFSNLRDHKIYADVGRMNQLMMNILGNAIKYTPEGGHISHSVTQVHCDRPGYATFVITTEDDGIGMSKEYLATIFEPFSRENSSTVSHIQGTGLGMAIVKRLVDLMGGKIDIESEQGKGTKITLTLTFRLQEKSTVNGQQSTEDKEVADFQILKGKRILLVEDNEMNREIAKEILQEYGMIVEMAEDGDIAVSKIQSVAECGEINYYDAILMDIQMPRMNGYAATREIRSTVPDLKTPIIALSANAFAEDKQKSREAGMDAHIAKPIDVEELMHTLAKFI